MKSYFRRKLSLEGETLSTQLRIISYLLFLLPFTFGFYFLYQEGFLQRLDAVDLLVVLFLLVSVLSGILLLRHIFEKFAMVSVFMKKAESGEIVLMDEEKSKDPAELLEISRSFNELVRKLDETNLQIERLGLDLSKACIDRHRAEEALIPLKKVVDIMQFGVTIADSSRKILYTNHADARMHGYEVDELIGRDVREFAPSALHKALTIEDFIAMKSWVRESLNICKDGSVFPVRLTSDVVLDSSGEFVSIVTTCEDITERKQWEEALKESEFFFKESQRVAFIGSYKADFITGAWQSSEVLDQIFGIDKHYPKTVQGWEDIIHPDDREEMALYLREEIIAKRNPFNKDYRIIRISDGEQRWMHGLGEVGFDATGKVIFLIGTIQDITERKMTADALKMNEERNQSLLKLYQIKFNTEKEIADFALEEVVRLTRSSGGYLHFFNEDEQTIQLFSWSKDVMKTCTAVQDQHYPLDSAGIWADSARTRGPVVHNNYQAITVKKGYPEGHFHLARHLGVPIFYGDRIVGVMGVGNKDLPYNESDVLQVTLFMNSMWSILHHKQMDIVRERMEEQLLRTATYDSLTGIFNRQALEKILLTEMARARRYDTSFSLVMLDIDDFKHINDTYGHQAGDRALIRIAEILGQNVRSIDSVGRWGGEEFIIQLPETNGQEAAQVAEKLRDAIANQKFDERELTASFGVSSYQKDDTLDTMIKRVDDLLYTAKGQGKNRVEA